MKKLLLLCLCVLPAQLWAQQIAGSWEGKLSIGDQSLRLVFHIVSSEGVLKATADSPDQGAKGMPVSKVVFEQGALTLDMAALGARYQGVMTGDDLIMGVFTQGALTQSLALKRIETEVMRRPQEPKPPYPYYSEEVEIPNPTAGITLKGTLTRPSAEGRYPAVILFTGSGTQNRDEEILGHKPFLVLSDYLTRRGFAVLRCDDRGYNMPREELRKLARTTTADLAGDAKCMFDFLLARPDIAPAKIGILGHSEGGSVAFMTAAQKPGVAFVISMAGMTVPGRELMVAQNRAMLGLQGVADDQAECYCKALEKIFAAAERFPADQIAAQAADIAAGALADIACELPESLRANLPRVAAAMSSPWMHYFLNYDPSDDIAAIGSRPFMAINGTKDSQVDAGQNLAAVERLTVSKRHPQSVIRPYEGLNHLFQPCTTGNIAEYGQIETTLSPQVLEDIAVWLETVTR